MDESMNEEVKPTPHMDDPGLACFQHVMGECRCYLEYGSGGSTVYAATVAKVPMIISIESDKIWFEKVVRSIAPYTNGGRFLHYCDIGPVGPWGMPVDRSKVENYWQYFTLPWRIAFQNNCAPDVVLIDGRFRVASFLFSLISARVGTTILFDDYLDRKEYFVVERFSPIVDAKGRMALFKVARNYSTQDLCERIAQYSVLPGI